MLIEMIDREALRGDSLRESGVITLTHRLPVCPLCDRKLKQDERFYLKLYKHCEDCEIRITPAILRKKKAVPTPRFPETFCSQCGEGFGPGDSGYSHCHQHRGKRTWKS